MKITEIITEAANPAQQAAIAIAKKKKELGETTMDYSIDPSITDFASISIIKKLKRDVHDERLPADPREIMRAGAELARYYQTELNLPLLVKQVLNGYGQGVAEGENWSKYNHKRVGGMSKKSVSSYRRSHPGSKIQTAVTTKPSKLKKGSKAAKRRASFCARMRGMKKHRTSAKTAHDPNSNINKSLRRWHCESIEQMQELVMLAEQFIRNHKK